MTVHVSVQRINLSVPRCIKAVSVYFPVPSGVQGNPFWGGIHVAIIPVTAHQTPPFAVYPIASLSALVKCALMLILNLENVLFTVYTPLLFSYLLYACVKHLLLYSSFFLLPPTSRPRIIIIYYDLPSNKDTTGINKGKQEGGEARRAAIIRFHSSWWFDLVYYIRTVQEYSRRVLNEQLKAKKTCLFFFTCVLFTD
jgi:hypothetical protein